MTPPKKLSVKIHNFEPAQKIFFEEVLGGLQKPHKVIPSKYLYDKRGSKLFEEITELDEYYPTATELGIMDQYAEEMAQHMEEQCCLIEFGSGSSRKTRLILDRLKNPAGYVPVDISKEHLAQTAHALNTDYPELEVLPVCADFTGHFDLPQTQKAYRKKVVYFPGSTIGNLSQQDAQRFLRETAKLCETHGGLLIGVDLKKEVSIIERAYNDRKGITQAFNLNVLLRINRELGANFDSTKFRHHAFYNEPNGRIEMHLVSTEDQTVQLDGARISFRKSETICTEHSYKYHPEEFEALAKDAGFDVKRLWMDEKKLFSIQYLEVRE
jgi:dimethylhistidine N-methyltransferase